MVATTRLMAAKKRIKETPASGSSSAANNAMEMLHSDLIFEILSRLPVKSLLRFKSVCKAWYALIKSKVFVEKHLKQSNLKPIPTFSAILKVTHVASMGDYAFTLYHEGALDGPANLPLTFPAKCARDRVLGVSNGLVCLTFGNTYSHIVICNPIIRGAFRKLPPNKSYVSSKDTVLFGFGSRANSGHELIRVVYRGVTSRKCREPAVEFDLFTMRTNTWRTIDGVIKKEGLSLTRSWDPESFRTIPVLLRGVYYWIANCAYDDVRVVSFDMTDEVFDGMRIPVCGVYYEESKLIDFKGELAITYCSSESLDLWALDQNEKTWARKFRINDLGLDMFEMSCFVNVVGCTNDGMLVLQNCYEDIVELFLYNPFEKFLVGLPCAEVDAGDQLYLFTESLFSPTSSDEASRGYEMEG